MRILDFLFGKTQKLEHGFFGTMLFVKDKTDPLNRYFECRRHFVPIDKTIEIGIDGDENGPTKQQIDFFKSIESNYSKITNAIAPLIEKEFGNGKVGFKIENFQREFEAVYLRLPKCDTMPIVWEIAFESDHDRNHTFTATMSDFEAKQMLIDG